jgi:hypothetical protein
MAELSGKGGEMVMGMVGARDKAGIGDIETLDIERFIELVHGERLKWLWYGKARKTITDDAFGFPSADGSLVFSTNDQGGFAWTSKRRDPAADKHMTGGTGQGEYGNGVYATEASMSVESPGDKEHLRKTVFKSVTGKMSDARSGLGRIKDAVGLRGHHHKHSKDDNNFTDANKGILHLANAQASDSSLSRPKSVVPESPYSSQRTEKDYYGQLAPLKTLSGHAQKENDKEHPTTRASRPRLRSDSPFDSKTSLPFSDTSNRAEVIKKRGASGRLDEDAAKDMTCEIAAMEMSAGGSTYRDSEFENLIKQGMTYGSNVGVLFRRTQSASNLMSRGQLSGNEHSWPRHLSFSEAEDAVLVWEEIDAAIDGQARDDCQLYETYYRQERMAEDARRLREYVGRLEEGLVPHIDKEVRNVEGLDLTAGRHQEELNAFYYQQMESCQNLKSAAEGLLAEEKSTLTEAIKDIEVLGAKLDYELNALAPRVEDIENAITEFESQVRDVETRAHELEAHENREGWLHWAVRLTTGFGQRPPLRPPND